MALLSASSHEGGLRHENFNKFSSIHHRFLDNVSDDKQSIRLPTDDGQGLYQHKIGAGQTHNALRTPGSPIIMADVSSQRRKSDNRAAPTKQPSLVSSQSRNARGHTRSEIEAGDPPPQDDEAPPDGLDRYEIVSSFPSSGSEDSDSSYDGDFDDPITKRNLRHFPPRLPSAGIASSKRWSQDGADRIRAQLQQLESEVNFSDSASSSAASNHDSPDARLPILWVKLQDKRQKIKELRRDMAARRREIQDLRRKKDAADNDFMKIVRPHLVSATSPRVFQLPVEVMANRFDEMQRIRSDYNFAESEYETLEKEIDNDEREVMLLETEFFSLLYGKTPPLEADDVAKAEQDDDEDAADDSDNAERPPSRTSLLGISGIRPVDVHPMYRLLLDAVGDRQLAREHHTDLLLHRDAILDDLENRLKLDRSRDEQGISKWDSTFSEEELGSLKSTVSGLQDVDEILAKYSSSVKEEELDFLREFKSEERAAREAVAEAEGRVSRLRMLCIEKGVMLKDAPYNEEYTIFADIEGMQFENINLPNENTPPLDSLANPRFPILLSNPRHVLEPPLPLTPKTALREATRLPKDDPKRAQQVADSMKEYGIANLMLDFVEKDKSDFINRWLLQRLRISPMEAELLFCVFSAKLKVVNRRRWQEDVLYFWPRDRANISPNRFEGPVTTRDSLQIEEENTANVNWDIYLPSRPGSEAPEELQYGHPRHPPTTPGRTTQSDPGDFPFPRRARAASHL